MANTPKVRPENIDFAVQPGNEFSTRYFGSSVKGPGKLVPKWTPTTETAVGPLYNKPPKGELSEAQLLQNKQTLEKLAALATQGIEK